MLFPKTRCQASKGYILLEVLLAMFIFCLVVVGLAGSLGDTASSMLSSNRESQVRLSLQSLIAQTRVLPVQLGVQTDPPDDTGISYQHEWKPLTLTNGDKVVLNNLYELIVRANWLERGHEMTQEARVYLYHP